MRLQELVQPAWHMGYLVLMLKVLFAEGSDTNSYLRGRQVAGGVIISVIFRMNAADTVVRRVIKRTI